MKKTYRLKSKLLALMSLAISLVGVTPMLASRAGADQITTRSLTLSTAVAGATNVTYDFEFDLQFAGGTSNVGSIELLFCTTPLGTCTAPTGMTVASVATGDILTQDIQGSGAGFVVGTNTANLIQLTRTAASVNDADNVDLVFDNITNPTNNTQTPAGNNSFYTRISVYSDNAYTTLVSDGVTAAAIVPVLTITARVQEILHFCVGSLEITYSLTGEDCSTDITTEGATVDLGPLSGTPTFTPVTVTGNTTTDDRDGAFMLRTNANVGASVSYYSVAYGGGTGGNLKKTGTNCGANAAADGCFDDSNAGATFVNDTEWFGMCLVDEDTASSVPTAVLNQTAPYDPGVSTCDVTDSFAWEHTTSTIDQVASANAAVDDEAFLLRFGAVAALTTPTGQYSTSADFIAVATY